MFKLVAVAGKLRGKEFVLNEGENTVGRDSSCSVVLSVDGISKKHFSMTVTGDTAYAEDLGSSNGTFLNGKIIKKATVKAGDKIALPDLILQVVYVKEKKVVVKKKVVATKEGKNEDFAEDFMTAPPPPKELPLKLLYLFRYKIMPIFHGINQEYEWRILLGISIAVFVVTSLSLTISPILRDSSKLLLEETANRGAHYADEIERINSRALGLGNLDQVDTSFLDKEPGVYTYELFDREGRIVSPKGKANEYISDSFSIKTRDWASKTENQGKNVYKVKLSSDEIGIGKNIMSYNMKTGAYESVGIIAIRFKPKSLSIDSSKSTSVYLEALVTSMIVGVFFFGFVYYLTTKPVDEMRFQLEEALRGKRRNIEGKLLMDELHHLKDSMNAILQRNRELQHDDSASMMEMEDDVPYVGILIEFMRGAGVPVMVLNSEKLLQKINTEAEDITGIRESASQGLGLLDICREKGFAASLLELCENSATNQGSNQQTDYELSGKTYSINVTALMGKDKFAKAYYVTFVKGE